MRIRKGHQKLLLLKSEELSGLVVTVIITCIQPSRAVVTMQALLYNIKQNMSIKMSATLMRFERRDVLFTTILSVVQV
jgi:hypothetical protein